MRCSGCRHEYLLAFSCKCRYFCPSCHAKRLALWSLWLEESLLAAVPHRQVVLAVPKRLRPYFLYHRGLLGDLARVAARTITAFIRATTGERNLAVGIVASIQTHGSLANWHPHLHLLVTDGGFRPDGTFVPLPLHDVSPLTEAFRRAVLRLFVRRELLEEETARGMLAWPHSGFHGHDCVWVPAEDRAFATRLSPLLRPAPGGAQPAGVLRGHRHGHLPVGQAARPHGGGRDRARAGVPGPGGGATSPTKARCSSVNTAGMPTAPAACGARSASKSRPRGSPPWYANRTRGIRRKIGFHEPPATVAADVMLPALADVRRRWAELLRRIFEVDPLRCPRCGDAMRVVGFMTQPHVIDQILTHLRRQAPPARRARAPPPRHRTAARTASSA